LVRRNGSSWRREGARCPGRACFLAGFVGSPGFVGSAHIVSPAGELGRLRYEPLVLAPIEVWERCLSPMAMAKAGHALSAVCVAAMGGFHPLAKRVGGRPAVAAVTGVTVAAAVIRTAGSGPTRYSLHRSPPRLISRAIGVPLAPATNGPWQSLTDAEVRRSDDVEAGIAQIPKLTVLDSGHLTPGPWLH